MWHFRTDPRKSRNHREMYLARDGFIGVNCSNWQLLRPKAVLKVMLDLHRYWCLHPMAMVKKWDITMISAEKRSLHHLNVWIFRDPLITGYSGKNLEARNDFFQGGNTRRTTSRYSGSPWLTPYLLSSFWIQCAFLLQPVHISVWIPIPKQVQKFNHERLFPHNLKYRKHTACLLTLTSYQIISYYSTLYTVHYTALYISSRSTQMSSLTLLFLKVVCVFSSLSCDSGWVSPSILP